MKKTTNALASNFGSQIQGYGDKVDGSKISNDGD